MSLLSTLPATWLLGLGFLIVAPDLAGQVPASDTLPKTASDSQRTLGDSGQKTDTAKATADTAKAASDTVQRAGPDSASKSDSNRASPAGPAGTAGQPAAPPDSIMSAACAGSAALARDLLVVVFAPEAGARERTAAAKSVGGTLLGPASPA